MDDIFGLFNNNFSSFNDLNYYFLEMNLNLENNSEQKIINDLFKYLVNRGYNREASDLWDIIIKRNFIAIPA